MSLGHQKIKVLSLCQSGFLWWPNIPLCINRIRIVQFIRFAPDLGSICTDPPHIHNLQAIHFSLPSTFSAFSIPKPRSEGCWAAKRKIANYPCLYLFYPWHTSTMSSILNSQSRKLFHFPRKLELLYHSQDEWWRCISWAGNEPSRSLKFCNHIQRRPLWQRPNFNSTYPAFNIVS